MGEGCREKYRILDDFLSRVQKGWGEGELSERLEGKVRSLGDGF